MCRVYSTLRHPVYDENNHGEEDSQKCFESTEIISSREMIQSGACDDECKTLDECNSEDSDDKSGDTFDDVTIELNDRLKNIKNEPSECKTVDCNILSISFGEFLTYTAEHKVVLIVQLYFESYG